MADYLRVKAETEAKFAREDAVTCECGHKAWEHYAFPASGCAWLSEKPIDAAGHLDRCECRKACEQLMQALVAAVEGTQ